jgi:hypothetical protein
METPLLHTRGRTSPLSERGNGGGFTYHIEWARKFQRTGLVGCKIVADTCFAGAGDYLTTIYGKCCFLCRFKPPPPQLPSFIFDPPFRTAMSCIRLLQLCRLHNAGQKEHRQLSSTAAARLVVGWPDPYLRESDTGTAAAPHPPRTRMAR